jgi:hypothetical protein
VRADEVVEAIKQDRQQQQQMAQMAQTAEMVTGGVKDLAGADLTKDSALKRLLEAAQAGRVTAA